MREKNPSMEFANKTALAYSAVCKPLCQELGLPQTAFDILLFLANNPTYKTASDIVEVRHIKATLVSENVDKLVQEGFLERRPVPGDRRKTELACTEKAQSLKSSSISSDLGLLRIALFLHVFIFWHGFCSSFIKPFRCFLGKPRHRTK